MQLLKKSCLILLTLLSVRTAFSQSEDSTVLRKIYTGALTESICYEQLRYLSNEIGGRLSGSPQAAEAVEWTKAEMIRMGFDSVWLQPCMVPHWVRGDKEQARVIDPVHGNMDVPICALGGSVGTGEKGIEAEVIEVHSLQEVDSLGEKAKGKIIFYNRPMDAKEINTFHAYGGCVDQRGGGAACAAKYGALGVIVRSMNLDADDHPHTGAMRYLDLNQCIPACAISTNGADSLSKRLKANPQLKVWFRMTCENLPDVQSYNVIGELKGSKYPDEIILVGGHLDSWDIGDGSHDDGAGCVQSMEVLHLFRILGIRPQRTIRVVLFMNEENGMRGAYKYAELAEKNGEKHIAAIESDRGGFTPRGFTMQASPEIQKYVRQWMPLFDPYLIHHFVEGYGGVDISLLAKQGTPLFGFVPDSQRYFICHHSHEDTFEHINKRELELGAATMTGLVYLIDKYGLPENQQPK